MPTIPPDVAQRMIDSFHEFRASAEHAVGQYRHNLRALLEQARQRKIDDINRQIDALSPPSREKDAGH